MFLIDNKYLVRKFYLSDAAAIFNNVAANRDYLRNWLGFVDDYQNVGSAFSFIDSCLNGYKNGTSFTVGIWQESEHLKRHIGTFGLNWIEGKTAELGCWIAEDYANQGIMSQAITAFFAYLKDNLPQIHTIVAGIAIDNQASRHLVEKLGFVLQAETIRNAECLYGRYVDHVIYKLNI